MILLLLLFSDRCILWQLAVCQWKARYHNWRAEQSRTMDPFRVRPSTSSSIFSHTLQQQHDSLWVISPEGTTLQHPLQARRTKQSIDHSFPPIPQKKEELAKSCELFVGIVEASVSADLGREEERKGEFWLGGACFLLGAFIPTRVLKRDGRPIRDYVLSSFSAPVFFLRASSAYVNFLCYLARIMRKFNSSALTSMSTSNQSYPMLMSPSAYSPRPIPSKNLPTSTLRASLWGKYSSALRLRVRRLGRMRACCYWAVGGSAQRGLGLSVREWEGRLLLFTVLKSPWGQAMAWQWTRPPYFPS